MTKRFLLFAFLFCAVFLYSCSLYYGIQGYSRYETDLGIIYIPKDTTQVKIRRVLPNPIFFNSVGYSLEDKKNGKKFAYQYTFMFADSSFFYIALGRSGDKQLTYHISEGSTEYDKGNVDGVLEYVFHDGYFEDTWIDTEKGKLNKTIAYSRRGAPWCCGMYVAGYQCPRNSDTTKYEKAIRSISWKKWEIIHFLAIQCFL